MGVLIRFRHEPIAMATDIEPLFHQVYVDPQDRNPLRFLWWPDEDLQKDPEEYCMMKHLFGTTPIHEITIQRLELTAGVISVKLSKIIREELKIATDEVNYWTDSSTVLKCLGNDSKWFHTFESNRLTVIRNGSSVSDWRYISRDDNRADDASKGLKLQKMAKDNRWLNGPTFLWKEEESWPTMIEVPRLKDNDVEVTKESRNYVTTVAQDPSLLFLVEIEEGICMAVTLEAIYTKKNV